MSAIILWWRRVVSAFRVLSSEAAAQAAMDEARDMNAPAEEQLAAYQRAQSAQAELAVSRAEHARLLRQVERRRRDARVARDDATRTRRRGKRFCRPHPARRGITVAFHKGHVSGKTDADGRRDWRRAVSASVTGERKPRDGRESTGKEQTANGDPERVRPSSRRAK